MRTIHAVLFVLVLAACSLTPEGVLIIERELELIKLPDVPQIPGRD